MESCHDNITVILGIRNSCQVKQRAYAWSRTSILTVLTVNNKPQCHLKSSRTEELSLKTRTKNNYSTIEHLLHSIVMVIADTCPSQKKSI